MPKHDGDRRRWIGDIEELQQLVGDSFARERHEVVGAQRAGFERRAVRLAASEPGVEAKIAKDPQMIFRDSLQGIADEAHVSLAKVVEAVEIIEYLSCPRVGRERIDGEIAPGRVLFPCGRKSDGRA